MFTQEDFLIFDKYLDGDNYEDEMYRRHFRLILDAVRNKYPLDIDMRTRRGDTVCVIVMPKYLEYSEKDDKMRLIGNGNRHNRIVNLGRIVTCKPSTGQRTVCKNFKPAQMKTVEFELIDERNALERVLLHFAHFEKQARKTDRKRYHVSVTYDADDETEIVIRLLSFGPMVKVTAPQYFIDLIRQRLIKQKNCGL